jgi:hypothetical protein
MGIAAASIHREGVKMQMIVILLAYAIALAACAAEPPAPVPVSEHHATAADELAREQGALLAHYDAALTRAEVLLRKAAIVIARADANANAAKTAATTEVKTDDVSLAAKARAGALELEQTK